MTDETITQAHDLKEQITESTIQLNLLRIINHMRDEGRTIYVGITDNPDSGIPDVLFEIDTEILPELVGQIIQLVSDHYKGALKTATENLAAL